MTRLEDSLTRACDALGITIELGFKLACPDGYEVISIARIHGVGATNGMLVISRYEDVKTHQECLELAGFGFSVLSGPGDKEVFDLDVYREIFCDWGWPGGDCPEPEEEMDM
jgi:hypothetical protein